MKKHNLSWVAALLVFGLLAMCTAATPGKIADPANYTCAVYSTMLSLLPPVIAIVLALITKEVYTSLLVGIASGALLYANGNLELAVNTLFFHTEGGMVYKLADPSNVGILVFLVMLGILVALMNKAGGSAAFGRWASSHIHTRAGAQLATLMLGVLIFVDAAECFPGKAGLSHRLYRCAHLHHCTGVQLGRCGDLLCAGRLRHQRLYHVPAHHPL